jgi:glycosyltransferase involved in cell wall biosynthesis
VRLLVISQYFWPENFRINDLVTGLVERRHQVTVLTGQPNYPGGRFLPGYGWGGPRREAYAGATVIRVPLVARGHAGRVRLTLNYLSFVVTACAGVLFRLPRGRTFDAILVFEPSPITVGIPAALARRRYRAPVLFWVLDLWPESLAAVGVVRSPWLARRVDALVRWIYRRCDLILAQSRAFVPAIVRHGVPESLVRYFPNWGEAVFDTPGSSAELPGLPPGFRILFAGNIGEAQDFPSIIEAAALLQRRTDIHWIIVGDGRLAKWAREEVARRGLDRTVHFLGQHPLDRMPGFFAAADALLVSLRNEPTFALTVPGKLQTYLACSRPVLAMLGGEGARIVAESGAGFHSPPGDAAGLAAIAERLAALPAVDRAAMGVKGREYFAEHFARERLFDRLDAWLVEATNAKPAEKPA